jgi:hypothetical protein
MLIFTFSEASCHVPVYAQGIQWKKRALRGRFQKPDAVIKLVGFDILLSVLET